jgi:cell division protein FtsL
MSRKADSDIQPLLDRTTREQQDRFNNPEPERRYVYGGEPSSRTFPLRPNRKSVRRKTSTFNIILLLFACGIAIVLYINNSIAVNQLAYEVDQLRIKYNAIQNTNAGLRAEINRKSGWERIGAMAAELGLRYPTEQPMWFEVDEEKAEKLEH